MEKLFLVISLAKINIKKSMVSILIGEWKFIALLIIEFRLYWYLSWKIFFANENFGIMSTKIQFILGDNLLQAFPIFITTKVFLLLIRGYFRINDFQFYV